MYLAKYVESNSTKLIEDRDGELHVFEFKWSPQAKARAPKAFLDSWLTKLLCGCLFGKEDALPGESWELRR